MAFKMVDWNSIGDKLYKWKWVGYPDEALMRTGRYAQVHTINESPSWFSSKERCIREGREQDINIICRMGGPNLFIVIHHLTERYVSEEYIPTH